MRAAHGERAPDGWSGAGYLLFSLVNLGRFIAVNPEEALRKTIARFIARFQYIEEELARRGRTPGQVTLEEMDACGPRRRRRSLGMPRAARLPGRSVRDRKRDRAADLDIVNLDVP